MRCSFCLRDVEAVSRVYEDNGATYDHIDCCEQCDPDGFEDPTAEIIDAYNEAQSH